MSKLRLYGSTSGYNELTVPAVADNSEINLGNVLLPAGTKQIFVQSSAPTGWTKDTSHNDKAMRIVSGTAGSGGSDAFTTTFGSGKTTAAHTLTESEIPAHTHTTTTLDNVVKGEFTAQTGFRVDVTGGSGSGTTTGSTGGDGGHSHGLSGFDLQYVDVIIATKD